MIDRQIGAIHSINSHRLLFVCCVHRSSILHSILFKSCSFKEATSSNQSQLSRKGIFLEAFFFLGQEVFDDTLPVSVPSQCTHSLDLLQGMDEVTANGAEKNSYIT
jgi:hypothetical protein